LPKKRTFANQNAKLKRLPKRRNFMLTRMLAEKERLVFLPELLPGKDKPVLKTYKANHEQSRSRETRQSKPLQTETQAKNLEADFSDLAKKT